eukprot:TRINITY_DN1372_c6_g1_i1.p2 TRINITY_DN1372_c6_g1~~TRINITY_DN1372_c6_g1_i1.p2  ORF type:complete len:130 (+),score=28.13 TRINITY_DN1372_c6_g1_i1:152-541(+)
MASIPRKPRPPDFVKVADIGPWSSNVSAVVKVVSCEARLLCVEQASHVSEAVVGDDTGVVTLRLREPSQAALCVPGATLAMRGARAELFDGRLRLELGRWSRLAPVDNVLFAPNVSQDLSSREFVLVPR